MTAKAANKTSRPAAGGAGRGTTPRLLLLAASFLSGAAALNYELLWVRELTLIAGSTQAAISAVLSAYFLGLALGSYVAGRFVTLLSRPLRAYMTVELLIGVWALGFPLLLKGIGPFYASLYESLPAGSAAIHALRLTSAALLLLVPATCMGATLPLLAQFGARDLGSASRWPAMLYGLNTLGAMAGTWATGFFLIEHLGVSTSLRLSALLNLACVACVFPYVADRRIGGGAAIDPAPPGERLDRPALSRFGFLVLLSFGVLGFANIAVEVLWTHFFSLIFPNDTYIFSTLLLMYLFGVGLG